MENNNKLDNGEMYIQEAFACIDYLLRHTDSENYTGASDIATDYLKKYGYEPRRQRLAKILNILVDSKEKTRRLGFVIDSIQTGSDPKRRKYYVSERLLTMQEINAIHIALLNHTTPLTGTKRINEIIEGLKLIYPTEFDNKANLINPDYLIPIKGKGITEKVCEIISRAFVEKLEIAYTLKGDLITYYGRIDQIYYQGGNNYEIKIIDDEFKTEKLVKIHDFQSIRLLYKNKIDYSYGHQLSGNLAIPSQNVNNFITIDKAMSYVSKPDTNKDKQYVKFKFTSLDIIRSFKKEFDIDLVNNLINEEGSDNNNDEDIKDMIASVRVSIPRFIIWAARPENILDIKVLSPFELNNAIRNRINYVNKLAQTKFNYITPNASPFLEINFEQNNEVTIVKIHGDAKTVEIPDTIMGYPVTKIKSFAATKHQYMEKLIIGENVKIIGACAFQGCKSLKEIEFGYGLEKISDCAFKDCTSLKEIRIESSLKEVGTSAFENCTSLNEALIASDRRDYMNVYNFVFKGCTSLEMADLAFIDCLGLGAFDNCPNLKQLYLRLSPRFHAFYEFINNPNTIITCGFDHKIPDINPFTNLSCYDQIYFDKAPWDWYND